MDYNLPADLQPALLHRRRWSTDAKDYKSAATRTPSTISDLEEMLRALNPLVQSLQSIGSEVSRLDHPFQNKTIMLGDNVDRNARTHNLPECHREIAALFEDDTPTFDVYLVICPRATNINTDIKRSYGISAGVSTRRDKPTALQR